MNVFAYKLFATSKDFEAWMAQTPRRILTMTPFFREAQVSVLRSGGAERMELKPAIFVVYEKEVSIAQELAPDPRNSVFDLTINWRGHTTGVLVTEIAADGTVESWEYEDSIIDALIERADGETQSEFTAAVQDAYDAYRAEQRTLGRG